MVIVQKVDNPDGLASQQTLCNRGWIIAPSEPNYLRRRTAGGSKLVKVGVSSHDRELAGFGILPDEFIRGVS